MTSQSTSLPSIFDHEDYKAFVREWVQRQPHRGRGQYRRMAQHLRVHTTLLSHVFRGSKELTPEHACALATFLGLDALDADYLLALVELARSGTVELRRLIGRRIAALRERHQQIEHRIPGARTLSRDEQSVFYSQWYYSAIRLAASLPDMPDANAIGQRLSLPPELVREALRFLVAGRLVDEDVAGFKLGTKRTHLGAGSPLTAAHHRNWRIRAMTRYERLTASEFAFTSPIALSQADALRIRELLVETVTKVTKIVEPSECETLRMLNIDWLDV